MAYSMFEQPKLQNSKSLKYYHEDFLHPNNVPCRHKDIHSKKDYSEGHCKQNLKGDWNDVSKKGPPYIKKFDKIHNVGNNNNKQRNTIESENYMLKKSYTSAPTMINKLEETYWATWKPRKPEIRPRHKHVENTQKRRKPKQKQPIDDDIITHFQREATNKLLGNCKEIQTDDLPFTLPEPVPEPEPIVNEDVPKAVVANEEKLEDDVKPMKHTDSFILNVQKQSVEKEHFEQPKCIRLYKKPGAKAVKGGSYTLKPCLKKESTFKGNVRLGRPGSPLFLPRIKDRHYKK